MENLKRRKCIVRTTIFFALMSLLDAFGSFPLIILCIRSGDLTEISSLIGCMQVACFLFLSFLSGCLMLRSKKFDERIDAIGAWVIIHFIGISANISFIFFQAYPKPSLVWKTSLVLTVLMGWKTYFVLLEIVSSIYCFYISHNPVRYYQSSSRRSRHPLFLDNSNSLSQHQLSRDGHNRTENPSASTGGNNIRQQNEYLLQHVDRPISIISDDITPLHNDGTRYSSYLSLSQTSNLNHVRNPCYESELSLDHANNYSPHEHRPYRQRGYVPSQNTRVSNELESRRHRNLMGEFQVKTNNIRPNRTSLQL